MFVLAEEVTEENSNFFSPLQCMCMRYSWVAGYFSSVPDKAVTIKRRWHFRCFVRILSVLQSVCLMAGCKISKGMTGFSYQEAVMHGKEKYKDKEFSWLVSKTKYFPLLNWNSQIENVAETKNVSVPFAFSHVKRMFLFGVPLRFWFRWLLMSGKELSPQPWQLELSSSRVVRWLGECREAGPGLATTLPSGLKEPQLWGCEGSSVVMAHLFPGWTFQQSAGCGGCARSHHVDVCLLMSGARLLLFIYSIVQDLDGGGVFRSLLS